MSPFRSKAQARWMYKTHPKMAAEWEDATPNMKKLPQRVRPKKKAKARKKAR